MADDTTTTEHIDRLLTALSQAPYADRPALGRRLKRARHRCAAGQPVDRMIETLQADIAQAVATTERRRKMPLRLAFPGELPVSAHVDEITDALEGHQVLVVCGETGSGKTTQIPKICLNAGRGALGIIGHTQPRRVAARSIAARIAQETATAPGTLVGYQVRFDDRTGPDCRVKLMTDGILLNELTRDRHLLRYDTIIIDEAHERSLNIDFLLGYLKHLLPRRPELRLIVTSATIDPQRFARHFNGAPVIEVSGRTYPVDIRYRPAGERDQPGAIVAAVDEIAAAKTGGDTLVFLAGEREIRETSEALRKRHPPDTEILPLYARLSAADQDKVFSPGGKRRIILATNVAETSLTVPGVTAVVDPGLARISRYSYRSKIQRLPIEPVSQASANQRAGRCGRTSDGICIRLYDADDFEQRPPFTDPEILRTNLASVILSMSHLGLGDVETFDFVEPPDRRLVKDGYRLLAELQAVDAEPRITPLGRRLARLPVDPRVGRMILAAPEHGCLNEVLVIAAALSIRDPRERPLDRQKAADEAHLIFTDSRSDFIALANLWRAWQDRRRHLSSRKLKAWCKEHFLSHGRMREWQDIHQQLKRIAADLGLSRSDQPARYDALHKALLSGLLGNIGLHDKNGEFRGARNARFRINPGSGLATRRPRWIMAAELVQTRRLYARTVATVKPAWIVQAAAHLVTRSLYDPYWAQARGAAMAFERVSLYGLELRTRERVGLASRDPALARELFVREGLVHGNGKASGPWRAHNAALIDRLRRDEAKVRRPGAYVDEDALCAFYESRVPAKIATVAAFESWHRRHEKKHPGFLYLDAGDATAEAADPPDPEDFPDTFDLDGNPLELDYLFDHRDPADGVTLVLPAALAPQLRPEAVEWGVPGLRRDKIAAILRGLPKSLRRRFVPAPDYAERFLAGNDPERLAGSLYESLAATMSTDAEPVSARQLRAVELPAHLSLNIRIVDESGRVVTEGRDLAELIDKLSKTGAAPGPADTDRWSRTGLNDWQFGELPPSVTLRQNRLKLVRYPAVVDEGASVGLMLCTTAEQALERTRRGVARLLVLRMAQQARYIRRRLLDRNQTVLLCHGLCDYDQLSADLLMAAVRQAFPLDDPPRTGSEFQRLLDQGRAELVPLASRLADLVTRILEKRRDILGVTGSERLPVDTVRDIRNHLQRLLPADFLIVTPPQWLAQFPRYLDAAARRLERLAHGGGSDHELVARLAPHEDRYLRALDDGADPEALAGYRWLLEEYRVSLFAQHLGTQVPVSPARLDREWQSRQHR